MLYVFFFFKQKTAYEVRISDWSSDVCSSDLDQPIAARPRGVGRFFEESRSDGPRRSAAHRSARPARSPGARSRAVRRGTHGARYRAQLRDRRPDAARHLRLSRRTLRSRDHARDGRSEEHTSELQSLMRISYAVFCLKKKNKT